MMDWRWSRCNGGTLAGAAPELAAIAALPLLVACASDWGSDDTGNSSFAVSTERDQGPDEMMIHGRRFIRNDLVSAAQSLEMRDPENHRPVPGPDERRALKQTGKPLNAPDERDVRRLAIQLMAHTHNEYGYYVQAEPDLEMARRILGADPGEVVDHAPAEPSEAPRGGRAIINTDDRVATTCPGCTPSSWVGFLEAGASGVLVGWTTIYTVAHMQYDNVPATSDGDGVGWICRNNTPDTNTAAPNTNPCDGPGDPGDSRWRFFNGLVTCGQSATVNNTWVTQSLLSNIWTRTRHDYAVVELSCNPGLGHMGSIILSGGGPLDTFVGAAGGYPGQFPCPPGSGGTPTDCPGGALQYGGGGPPWTSAVMYWTPQTFYFGGTQEAAHTWRVFADNTGGMSGGPLMQSNNRATGIASHHQTGSNPVNMYNRLTGTVWNFIVANSSL